MNACLWIIVLLACRGNCGLRCNTTWRRCNNRMNECEEGSCEHNDDCVHEYHGECGCVYKNEVIDNDDYGCACSVENSMTYETFGCQENGVPCPPPIPGNYMR